MKLPRYDRPAAGWNDGSNPLKVELSAEHDHEFGRGFDLYYKDAAGRKQAWLDGLRIDEAMVLKKKHGV